MTEIRLFHLADVHFGCRARGISPASNLALHVGARRIEAYIEVMKRARNEAIDGVIVAGDLFDRPDPPAELRDLVAMATGRAAPIPVFIVPGNHDYAGHFDTWHPRHWPDNAFIASEHGASMHDLPGTPLTLIGCGWTAPTVQQSPFLGRWEEPPRPERINVLVAHGSELSLQPREWKRYAPFYAEQLSRFPLDYVAMGHLHYHCATTIDDRAPVVYPGSFASTGFDDPGHKGYVEVTIPVPRDGNIDPARRPIATYQPRTSGAYEFAEITLLGDEIKSTESLIRAMYRAHPAYHDTSILRVNLVGVMPEPMKRELKNAHQLASTRYAHLQIRDLTATPAAASYARNPRGISRTIIADLDGLIATEKNPKRRAALERARQHALTFIASEAQAGKGIIYN